MNCRGVSRRLSAYIDAELSPGIRRAVEEHLEGCVVCKRKLGDYRAISEAARSLAPLKVSDGFKARVMASAKTADGSQRVFYGFRMRVAVASFAFVAAAAVVFVVAGPDSTPVEVFGPQQDLSDMIVKPHGQPPETMDFISDPKMKIEAFPVPEGAMDFTQMKDSLMENDSLSKIDEFVLPVIEKSEENVKVNVKF
jgi:hypothetical protein